MAVLEQRVEEGRRLRVVEGRFKTLQRLIQKRTIWFLYEVYENRIGDCCV